RVLQQVQADASGAFTATLATPDDLGGGHTLRAVAGDASASVRYVITPSVALVEPQVVAPGGDITITIKGVGWTETANIYTLLLDNGNIGYGGGFNSQGDVRFVQMEPGREVVHYSGLCPSTDQGAVVSPGGPMTPDAN